MPAIAAGAVRMYVARHGETRWNVAGRYQGRHDSALTALGERQGRALAAAIGEIAPPIARIVASPLGRARATAGFAAETTGLAVEADHRLIEIAHGRWEGRFREEIRRADAARFERWQRAPGDVAFEDGETLADVAQRWNALTASGDVATSTLLVTHDVVVRVAILAAQGRPFADFWDVDVANAGFAVFVVEPSGAWRLERESVTAHLRRADALSMTSVR